MKKSNPRGVLTALDKLGVDTISLYFIVISQKLNRWWKIYELIAGTIEQAAILELFAQYNQSREHFLKMSLEELIQKKYINKTQLKKAKKVAEILKTEPKWKA